MPKHTFVLNGKKVTVDAPDDHSLLWVLRDMLGVTGPKCGCNLNVCKACTCLIDGVEFTPCATRVADVAGREITTIEGLADGDKLHPVQEAWLEYDVSQCGFCQPGQIMKAVGLLNRKATITDDDIDEIENVCRCGSYARIREAIKAAATKMR
ncbi:(2Fe-2S)-binding protein [Thermocrispum sp.]|uniref:(2Fe-2S)-binding protein n=1 Tax=Thermocrispum sp. TaxID=2060768 RepID=UPI00257C7BBE|nr:(2Fe-2S)-binding protein [Thermocrispum sp.]